ncbi:MAG: MarR family transcriptional regulator [Nanoarchaeota archaeon]|nr:MarR family transcriptional regulator [Nanoarchaeota archaeon]
MVARTTRTGQAINVFLAVLFALVFSAVFSAAEDYYADIGIIVGENGAATISGDTNHPMLQHGTSQEFTGKNGRYWLLNISIYDSFSDFIYELTLPEGSVINYLKTPKLARIDEDGNRIRIIGTGKDQPFVLIVQYQIEAVKRTEYVVYTVIAAVIVMTLLVIIYLNQKKNPKNKTYKKNLGSLTTRQRQIFDFLQRNKGSMTQAELEKNTGLPKSSLSRNIESMRRKGMISKQRKGMSNMITLEK